MLKSQSVRAKTDSDAPVWICLTPMFETGFTCFFYCFRVKVLVTHAASTEFWFLGSRMRGWRFITVHGLLALDQIQVEESLESVRVLLSYRVISQVALRVS